MMPQGTAEWLAVRAGIPTASEISKLITPAKMQVSTGKGVDSYLAEKLAERWLGRPLEASRKTWAMDAGTVLEDHALPKFELETGLDLERVGFVTTDDGRFGCSPDSLLAESDVGLEAKCPKPETHVGYLIGGELPADYRGQVQGSMFATGAVYWWFMSYCPGFPEFIIKVDREPKYQVVLQTALWKFQERLEKGWARLLEINGGVEPVRARITEEEAAGVITRTLEGMDPANGLDGFYDSKAYGRIGA